MKHMSYQDLDTGTPIPVKAGLNSVSVFLKYLRDVIGYEEGDPELRAKLQSGYPRFVFPKVYHEVCGNFRKELAAQHKLAEEEELWVWPSASVAEYCLAHVKCRAGEDLSAKHGDDAFRIERTDKGVALSIFPKEYSSLAREVYMHSGLITSFRRLSEVLTARGPQVDNKVYSQLRARVADIQRTHADDVFLYPTGMAAIHGLFRATKENRGSDNVQLGFTYVDTGEVLDKFGDSNRYIRYDKPEDLDELAKHLRSQQAQGKSVSGIFCEVPSNPLLRTIDVEKIGSSGEPVGKI